MKHRNELEMKRRNELKMNGELKMNQEKNVEMNPIVTFTAEYHQETINGYMYLDEADDETPLRFYDFQNNEVWQVPSNPNDMDTQYDWWADYDYLSTVFQETDIVTLLCDFKDKINKKIILEETINEPVYLIINKEE